MIVVLRGSTQPFAFSFEQDKFATFYIKKNHTTFFERQCGRSVKKIPLEKAIYKFHKCAWAHLRKY